MANFLTNPSFEIGDPPTDWAINYGVGAIWARSNAQVQVGSYSGALTRVNNDCGIIQGFVGVIGKTYTARVWVWASVANSAQIYLYDGTNVGASGFHPGDSTWRFMTAVLTAVGIGLSVNLQVVATNSTAYFDQAVAELALPGLSQIQHKLIRHGII
jgi:hypothetical protein